MKKNNLILLIIFLLLVFFILFFWYFYNKYKEYLSNIENQEKINQSFSTFIEYSQEEISEMMSDEFRLEKFRSIDSYSIRKLLPENSFLRDFAYLPNNLGILALYIEDYKFEPGLFEYFNDLSVHPVSCFDSEFGHTINGKYKLALIGDNDIISEVLIPFVDFENWPITSRQDGNYLDLHSSDGAWTYSGSLSFINLDCENGCIFPDLKTREISLLNLQDLTGDGKKFEILLKTEYLSCGNSMYSVIAYNELLDKVMVYPFLKDNGDPFYSLTNLVFDDESSYIVYNSGCDHGSEKYSVSKFKFDKNKKAYVLKERSEMFSCFND